MALSPEQVAHLAKLSPGVAKRWARMSGGGSSSQTMPMLKANPVSKDSKAPPRTDSTDYEPLKPGPSARHMISPRSNEMEAQSEGKGVQFQPESRKGPLGSAKARKPLHARDVRAAAVRRL